MPRSPEGVYSKPPGTNGGPPNSPISSTAYNSLMNDIAQDLNTPRPVVAGGMGANTAIGGIDNLHTASVPIPSSTTTDLSGASGMSVLITGSTSIEDFGTVPAGATRVLTFEDDLTIVYDEDDVKIIMPKAEDYEVQAGEVVTLISEGAGVWRMVSTSLGAGGSGETSVIIHEVDATTLSSASSITVTGIEGGFRRFEIEGSFASITSNPSTVNFLLSVGDGTTWFEINTVAPLVRWTNGGQTARYFFATVDNLDDDDLAICFHSKTANELNEPFTAFVTPAQYASRPITALRFRIVPPSGSTTLNITKIRIRGIRD